MLYTVICKPCRRHNTRLANVMDSYPLWARYTDDLHQTKELNKEWQKINFTLSG
jgi:hypothetical protein